MIISRRGLITGLVSLVAAPAIVRAGSLMPVRVWSWTGVDLGAGDASILVRCAMVDGSWMVGSGAGVKKMALSATRGLTQST